MVRRSFKRAEPLVRKDIKDNHLSMINNRDNGSNGEKQDKI